MLRESNTEGPRRGEGGCFLHLDGIYLTHCSIARSTNFENSMEAILVEVIY